MGVLPLQFIEGEDAQTHGLTGHEVFHIEGLSEEMQPNAELSVRAEREDGSEIKFKVITRLDTPLDIDVYKNGGILHAVLREMLVETSG